MASDDSGGTVGIWIGESDESMLAEFDEAFRCGPGPTHGNSRSDAIKEAMRLAIAVRETVDEFPYDVEGAPLRHQVQQALIEQDRREARRTDE